MKLVALTATFAAVAALAAAVPDVESVVTTAQINAAGAPVVASDIELLASDSTGRLIFSNAIDTNDADGFAIVRVTLPGPTLAVLAGATEVLAAVDAANGANPAPANLTARGLCVDSAGNIIVAFDPSGSSDAWLVRITPGSPSTVEAIAGAAVPNYIDGCNSLAVVGTTAYVIRNGAFAGAGNAPEDSVATFSTAGAANGAQAGTLLLNEATLTGAGGFNEANTALVMNGACAFTGTDVLLVDSGAAASSDSIGKTTSGGAFSIQKLGTALETDLSYVDVGFACVTANTATGDTYLWLNDFNDPTTDGNAFVAIPGGTGTAKILITEAEIAADPDYGTTGLFTNTQGIALAGGFLYWTDDNLEGIYRISDSLSSVADWSVY